MSKKKGILTGDCLSEVHSKYVPYQILGLRCPRPRRGIKLEQMGLRRRTRNVLSKAGYREDPTGVGDLTVRQVLKIPGFGITSLCDWVDTVDRLDREKGKLVPVSKGRAAKPSTRGKLSASDRETMRMIQQICALPAATQISSRDPRLGHLLHEVHSHLDTVGDLKSLSNHPAILSRREQLQALKHEIENCLQQSVEAELSSMILSKKRSPRDKRLIDKYYGFGGRLMETLEVIGQKNGLTRQRIQQICTPARVAQLDTVVYAPKLDQAIAILDELSPVTIEEYEAKLVEDGVIKKGTSWLSIRRIARFLGREFDYRTVGSSSLLLKPTHPLRSIEEQFKQLARKSISAFGFTTIEEVIAHYGEQFEIPLSADLAENVVDATEGFQWLIREDGVFWITDRPSRLRRRIVEVLSLCSPISAQDLGEAVARDLYIRDRLPSSEVLLEICRQMPEAKVRGKRVSASLPLNPKKVFSGDEGKVVSVLLRHGPVCRRSELRKKAAATGVGRLSFDRCLSFCPAFKRYARGVQGLVGAKVTAAMLRSLTESE
ncbi:MAG: hypothetical protein MI861_20605 [Pirellulales bacterium]|nr:hypothetical protein [Pirellulales bacterium]